MKKLNIRKVFDTYFYLGFISCRLEILNVLFTYYVYFRTLFNQISDQEKGLFLLDLYNTWCILYGIQGVFRLKKEEVLADIKRKIITGEIHQGAFLTEREIGETYGISRTPVREILWNLCSVNLAEQDPDKGCRVKTYSINDMIEVYNTREAIESSCARLACLSKNPDFENEIDKMISNLEAVNAYDNLDKCVEFGIAVHKFTRRECNNKFLLGFLTQIEDVTTLLNYFAHKSSEIEEVSRIGHIAILNSLKKRDQSASAKAMAEHIATTCQNIVKLQCDCLLLKTW